MGRVAGESPHTTENAMLWTILVIVVVVLAVLFLLGKIRAR